MSSSNNPFDKVFLEWILVIDIFFCLEGDCAFNDALSDGLARRGHSARMFCVNVDADGRVGEVKRALHLKVCIECALNFVFVCVVSAPFIRPGDVKLHVLRIFFLRVILYYDNVSDLERAPVAPWLGVSNVDSLPQAEILEVLQLPLSD